MHLPFGLSFSVHESKFPFDGSGVELTPVGSEMLLIRVLTEESLAERAARLTPSERAVVALAVAGRSNGAIAAERGSSPRTIANQLATAYQKLGLSGRRELRAGLRGQKS
jgi:DNA-binding CsgD family transcriptional regulator